jgi:predicted ribosome quality control (RQC) complex YloA/Tae2 family protein
MNEITLKKVCVELESTLVGQKFGKIFLLSRFRFAIDFRLPDSKYLFISIEPTSPRIYLITRRFTDLEKQTRNETSFALLLRHRLGNSFLQNIEKFEDERILRFEFLTRNDVGQNETYFLIVQLTGRSANLFLLDENDFILDACRENSGEGQEVADKYSPPKADGERRKYGDVEIFPHSDFGALSEALDSHFTEKEIEQAFQAKAKAARNNLNKEISKRKRLVKNLKKDLENHGDAENWKRFGDLLLANLATAKREGEKIFVTDFYDETTPTIEIAISENDSISEAAEKFFKRYTKARNAKKEIAKRMEIVEAELKQLNKKKEKLERAIAEEDEGFISQILGKKEKKLKGKNRDKHIDSFTGARRFTSSDGFEILVGRRSKDNDYLTFRVAKSLDLWLHAADYPGSHVVVRNPNRNEIPQNTLLEAAQLAAFYSKAKEQAKVAVHYTQRKFVNKPKGAVPGLVSLASFKTILVVPKKSEQGER